MSLQIKLSFLSLAIVASTAADSLKRKIFHHRLSVKVKLNVTYKKMPHLVGSPLLFDDNKLC